MLRRWGSWNHKRRVLLRRSFVRGVWERSLKARGWKGNVPSSNSLYVDGNSGQKPVGKSGQSGWVKFVRMVLRDKSLSFCARCVYAELAGSTREGNTVTIGHRRLAHLLGANRETVGLALRELEAKKHISIVKFGKQRHIYVLHSEYFAQKQGKQDIVRNGRYVSLDHERHGIAKAGTA